MNFDLSKFDRFKVTFQKGDQIFCEYEPGDSFYLIKSGRVQIVKIMGDIEKILDILHPGEIFGEMAILEEAPRSASAIAADKIEVFEFNRKNFEILLQGNPQIAMKLLMTFIKRIYDQKRRFMILTLPDAQTKVADALLMLSKTLSAESSSINSAIINTTTEDIAHWCGLLPTECQQVVENFTQQRKIEIDGDKIMIKNISDLQRFVNFRRKR